MFLGRLQTHKHLTTPERPAADKHFSLLGTFLKHCQIFL
jgi:hypothetical protein